MDYDFLPDEGVWEEEEDTSIIDLINEVGSIKTAD